MAKRFTDTGKWGKASFSDLTNDLKLVWIYLCDNCDHAGVWDVNWRLIAFHLGLTLDQEMLASLLGDRVKFLSPTKLFIPSFIDFQYGALNPDNRAHQSVISRLKKEGAYKGLTRSSQGRKDKEQDKEIGNGNGKRGSAEGAAYSPDFESAWKIYPRKDDKSLAYKAYLANTTLDDRALVLRAVENYRAKLKRDETPAKFIKLGATFFNGGKWRDCLDPSYGQAEDFSAGAPSGGDYRTMTQIMADKQAKGEAS